MPNILKTFYKLHNHNDRSLNRSMQQDDGTSNQLQFPSSKNTQHVTYPVMSDLTGDKTIWSKMCLNSCMKFRIIM